MKNIYRRLNGLTLSDLKTLNDEAEKLLVITEQKKAPGQRFNHKRSTGK